MPSRLSDAFTAHPVHLHHKNIDINTLEELPDSYIWVQPEPDPLPVSHETVPVIDLDDPNVVGLIGHACETWGVFQILNHGIPDSLLSIVEETSGRLFSLPSEQKLKASRKPDGVSGYGLARISSFFSKLMWSEGFTIAGSPLDHFRQLWPQDYTHHCDVIEEYEKEMKKLAGRLMWLIMGSLGITKGDIKWAGPNHDFQDSSSAIQLNHYPSCPDPDRAMGLAPHTDSTLFTILYQNNISGLQVMKEGSGWVTVPPVPGGLVVNIGDLIHMLSNGSYPSVLHRAMVNREKHRLSIAYLYGPPTSVQISPLPNLVGPTHPPLFRPITWSEYLGTKAKYFNNALSTVRVN